MLRAQARLERALHEKAELQASLGSLHGELRDGSAAGSAADTPTKSTRAAGGSVATAAHAAPGSAAHLQQLARHQEELDVLVGLQVRASRGQGAKRKGESGREALPCMWVCG